MESNSMEEPDFIKQRDKMTISIRRAAREQKFNKKRYVNQEAISDFLNQVLLPANGSESNSTPTIIDSQNYHLIEELIQRHYDPSMFDSLVCDLYSPKLEDKYRGIIGIRKIVSAGDKPPVHLLLLPQYNRLESGQQKKPATDCLFKSIVELMSQNEFPHFKLQATWILTNVAAGEPEETKALVEANAIPTFVRLLKQNQEGIVDQAIWAVGNIAGDATEYRDQVIAEGAVPALVKIMQGTSKNNEVQCSWALANICRGSPLPKFHQIKEALPALCKVITKGILDSDNLADCLWAISYMTEGSKDRLSYLTFHAGVFDFLVQRVSKKELMTTIVPALRILCNISSGSRAYGNHLFKAGILSAFFSTVDHPKMIVRREICWILSNLCANSKEQTSMILNHEKGEFIKTIRKMFESDCEDVKVEICYVFSNLTFLGDSQLLKEMFEGLGIVEGYCECLRESIQNGAVRLKTTILDTLPIVLTYGQKLEKLLNSAISLENVQVEPSVHQNRFAQTVKNYEVQYQMFSQLQMDDNEEIQAKAARLCEEYLLDRSNDIMFQ